MIWSTITPSPLPRPPGTQVDPPHQHKIEHFIVLLKENRAFDHIAGCMDLPGPHHLWPTGCRAASAPPLLRLWLQPSARVLSFCCIPLVAPLLKHLLKGEGRCSRMAVSPMAIWLP